MTAPIDLTGHTALVTGAARGIGRATAERLAGAGARVLVTSRAMDGAEAVAFGLRDQGHEAIAAACDVTRHADLEAAVAKAVDAYGALDIVVANAGTIEPIADLADGDPAAWAMAVQTNLMGVYHTMRAALPVMRAQGRGTIVTISSGAANSALPGWSAYCATKAATKKLTECAAREAAPHGVHVVGLSPGTVATDMMRRIKASDVGPVAALDWDAHIPTEWAAEAVLYLCGPGGARHAGTDFSIKTPEGRAEVGLPPHAEAAP